MTLKRSEFKRGTTALRSTKPMSRGAPMNRGTSQLARTGPIKAKVLKEGGQRVQIGPVGVDLEAGAMPVAKAPPARKSGLKTARPKMNAIRSSAKDEECTLRFPCCNYRTDTTVLCHRNGAGAGMKAEDTDAAYGCYACHTVLDGHAPRPEGFTRDMMLARFDVAVELTYRRLTVKGLVAEKAAEVGAEKQKPIPVASRDRLQLKTLIRAAK